jgi:hypothetical protein
MPVCSEGTIALQQPGIQRLDGRVARRPDGPELQLQFALGSGRAVAFETESVALLSVRHPRMSIGQRRQQPGQADGPAIVRVDAEKIDPCLFLAARVGSQVHLGQRGNSRNERHPAGPDLQSKQDEAQPGISLVRLHLEPRWQVRPHGKGRHPPVQKEKVEPTLHPDGGSGNDACTPSRTERCPAYTHGYTSIVEAR